MGLFRGWNLMTLSKLEYKMAEKKMTRGEIIDFLQSEEFINPTRLDEFRKILRETDRKSVV